MSQSISFIAKCENVDLELKKAATRYNTTVGKLDFKIRHIDTVIKQTETSEWVTANSDDIRNLHNPDFLSMEELQVIQKYEIEIVGGQIDRTVHLKMGLGMNTINTKVVVVIKKGSRVDTLKGITDALNLQLNKLKLKKNIYVNLWDDEQKKGVDELVKAFKANLILRKDVKFVITNVPGYKDPINDLLIEHYKGETKSEHDENDKVDHFSRGFIIGVKSEDLLLEYIKPHNGVGGKDCKGAVIESKLAVIEHTPMFLPSENIQVEDTDDYIKYYAKKSGFIIFEGNKLDIEDNMDLKQIDMKTTGHIKVDLDTGIGISISEPDPMKDAIGSGVEIEVTDIKIKGNVGGNTNILCVSADIDGQTHQDAVIKAETATIKIHKGKFIGDNVIIERLENGFVDANYAEIGEVVGGEVRANKIKVTTAKKNASLYASEQIEITNITDDDNVFILTPLARQEDKEKYELKKEELTSLEDKLKYIIAQGADEKKEMEAKKKNYQIIIKKLNDYKVKGVKFPEKIVEEYKKYKKILEEYNTKIQGNNNEKTRYKTLQNEFAKKQDEVLDAKIVKKVQWGAYYSKVIFELIKNNSEMEYLPKNKDLFIKLHKIDDKYEIHSSVTDK